MGQEIPGLVIAVVGLIGAYLIALVIEVHYTAFSTAFGNLACLLCCSSGLILDNPSNPRVGVPWLILVVTSVILGSIIYMKVKTRMVHRGLWRSTKLAGQGLIVTSLALGMIVHFYFGVIGVSVVVGIVNAIVLWLVRQRLHRFGSRVF